jgi:hypothetical protein
MKAFLAYALLVTVVLVGFRKKSVLLFDGKTFRGWEGDTVNTWRIEEGALVAGSRSQMVPHNDFLCTTRPYSNFILRLKVKLTGTKGFVNGGVQFHSQRLRDPAYEMVGYQADCGPGYWGGLYDESRRNVTLAKPDSVQIARWVKVNDWNTYEIRSQNRRIQLFINNHQTVDYTEKDTSIPQSGLIGLQVHGGGITQIAYKELLIEELP